MKLIFSILLFLHILSAHAQFADNTDRHNVRNIYTVSVKKLIDYTKKSWSNTKLSINDTLFIYQDTKAPDSLLEIIDGIQIVKVEDPHNIISTQGNRAFNLYSIFPLQFEKGVFSVTIVLFQVSQSTSNTQELLFNYSGSYRIYFTYSKGGFHFKKFKSFGI